MTEKKDRTFLYFAYGSNMLSQRLQERTPSASAKGTGYVLNRKLTFNKESSDGSGKCDIKLTANSTDRVYGVLFEIACEEEANLDEAEGKGYSKKHLMIITPEGPIEAITYIATAPKISLCPYQWYKDIVIAGATEHKLPVSYIEWIRTFSFQDDPDTKRRTKYESLLTGAKS